MSKNQSFAWGGNNYGQLGYPSYNVNFVQVSNIDDVIESAGGYSHSLVLKQDGTVWAWGYNYYGQLGDGTTNDSNEPVKVKGLTNIKAIAAGYYHSLAIKDDGTVWAWGYNYYGQLGDETTDNSNEPVQVKGLTNVKSVAGGQYHSLAIQEGETEEYLIAWAWGDNSSGQLGSGEIGGSTSTPVQVVNLTNVKSVAAGGYHSLAIQEAKTEEGGIAWAWGGNWHGQLGNGTTEGSTGTPVQVIDLTNVKSVTAGANHSLAIEEGGIAWAWGNNWAGQLGNGTTGGDNATPQQVKYLENVIDISGGENHSLAITSDGTAWAWGYNYYGQLGDGTTNDSNEPVQVSSLINAKSVVGGGNHSLTVKNDGTMWSWGNNYYGQLGMGYFGGFRSSPVLVNSINNIQDIAAGNGFNLTLKSDKKVRAWGINWYGQLGDGTTGGTNYIPVEVDLTDVIGIAAGYYHGLAIKSDGTAWTWGNNWAGQLGNGTTGGSIGKPEQVINLTNVVTIGAGYNHSLAIKSDGTVWAWGYNGSGQLGNGTIGGFIVTPEQVVNLTNVIAISGGANHSLALKSDGTVWAWGLNNSGQLGDGTNDNRDTPVQVTELTNVIGISGGGYHSLAIKSDGTVWVWGYNFYGQLGDGTNDNRDTPVQVKKLTNIKEISGGEYHSLAVGNNGTAWAWGKNNYGQLGDETYIDRNEPVQVSDMTNSMAIVAGIEHSLALRIIRATRGIPFM